MKKPHSSKAKSKKIDPIYLEIKKEGYKYFLCHDDQPLIVDKEIFITHDSTDLLEHMISEFEGQGRVEIKNGKIISPKFFGSFGLYSIQKKWIEDRKDDLSKQFEILLLNDPVFHRVAGPEQVDQIAKYAPINKWLESSWSELNKLASETRYFEDIEIEKELEKNPDLSFEEIGLIRKEASLKKDAFTDQATKSDCVINLKNKYNAMSPEERTVVMNLFAIHENPVLFPMALVLNKCSESEYAMGVMASKALLTTAFGDVKEKDHKEIFESLRSHARTALEYINIYRKGTHKKLVDDLIAIGEAEDFELKSTLRWNLNTDKKDENITHSCIKTISAFLNSKGGKLLIGVSDGGNYIGIDKDRFKNNDKFMLHLTNSIKQSLGENVFQNINIQIIPVDEYNFCLIDCEKSSELVFCKKKGGDENVYIRIGPSSAVLPPSKLVEYKKKHFDTL